MRSRAWIAVLVVVIFITAGVVLLLSARGCAPPSTSAVPSPSTATQAVSVTLTPTSPPLPSPTPGPLTYVIQDGDTLFGIATAYGITLEELIAANNLVDPNVIRPGDVLVIPGHTAPPEATPAVPLATEPPRPLLPTPTPSGPPEVVIAGVLGAGDLAAERIRLRNDGGAASLEGWTLSSAAGNSFSFPRLVLFSGGEVTVHSGSGQNLLPDLYWGRTGPAWTSGELLVLKDGEGGIVDTYIVP